MGTLQQRKKTCHASGIKLHSIKEETAFGSFSCTKHHARPSITSMILKYWLVTESIEQLFWYTSQENSGSFNKLFVYVLSRIQHQLTEFPFTHSCAYLTHKNLKGCSLFHASASQGCMEACSFYKLHDNLSA